MSLLTAPAGPTRLLVTDPEHAQLCEGWLPTGVCTCKPWIVVAPTARQAIQCLPYQRPRTIIVYDANSAQRLRGLRNGSWHLELIGYPECSHGSHDTEVIQYMLVLAGWQPEEVI